MGHSYTSSLFHCVFSTKERERSLSPEIRERLWPFIGGIARENGMRALEVGGVDDHAHMLLSLPSTMAIAKAMQLVKAGSSKFVHEAFGRRGFAWQQVTARSASAFPPSTRRSITFGGKRSITGRRRSATSSFRS